MMVRRNVRTILKLSIVAAALVAATMVAMRLIGPSEMPSQRLEVGGAMPLEPAAVFEALNRAGEQLRDEHHQINGVLPPDEKIDWHDYEKIKADSKRSGPGEQGVPVHLKPEDEHEKKELYKVNGFNGLASDRIALNRSLPDIRHLGCKKKKYQRELPQASVVVPFHNEHLSTLLRTATTVLERSPSHLIKEVILVDDCSTKDLTRDPLDDYLRKNLPKVRVVRLKERSGLIRARLAGAREATGEVLIFLDSHSEANVNWLPPLLDPIARDYRTCVCPFIDVIDFETFQYRAQDEGARGAFDWELFYKRLPLLPEDLKHPTEPFKSPVMAGGLFAISSKFFWELGGYDPGLEIWGGEQYELSFKIWQCGGSMVDAPCSRVGHIYRKFAPFPNPHQGKDFVGKNYMRVATVWMDEYKEYIFKRRPHYRNIDPGDLSEQLAIRERLKCKDFKWFMTEVAFDLVKKYPPIEPPDFASGEIRSVAAPKYCVDTKHKGDENNSNSEGKEEKFGMDLCIKDTPGRDQSGSEQSFTLTWHKDVRPSKRSMCWDVASPNKRAPVTLWSCHGMQGNQLWRYKPETQQLIHGGNPRCLECDPTTLEIFVSKCDSKSEAQRWQFEKVDTAAISNWDKVGPQ